MTNLFSSTLDLNTLINNPNHINQLSNLVLGITPPIDIDKNKKYSKENIDLLKLHFCGYIPLNDEAFQKMGIIKNKDDYSIAVYATDYNEIVAVVEKNQKLELSDRFNVVYIQEADPQLINAIHDFKNNVLGYIQHDLLNGILKSIYTNWVVTRDPLDPRTQQIYSSDKVSSMYYLWFVCKMLTEEHEIYKKKYQSELNAGSINIEEHFLAKFLISAELRELIQRIQEAPPAAITGDYDAFIFAGKIIESPEILSQYPQLEGARLSLSINSKNNIVASITHKNETPEKTSKSIIVGKMPNYTFEFISKVIFTNYSFFGFEKTELVVVVKKIMSNLFSNPKNRFLFSIAAANLDPKDSDLALEDIFESTLRIATYDTLKDSLLHEMDRIAEKWLNKSKAFNFKKNIEEWGSHESKNQNYGELIEILKLTPSTLINKKTDSFFYGGETQNQVTFCINPNGDVWMGCVVKAAYYPYYSSSGFTQPLLIASTNSKTFWFVNKLLAAINGHEYSDDESQADAAKHMIAMQAYIVSNIEDVKRAAELPITEQNLFIREMIQATKLKNTSNPTPTLYN